MRRGSDSMESLDTFPMEFDEIVARRLIRRDLGGDLLRILWVTFLRGIALV
jgi:hypothetical protein